MFLNKKTMPVHFQPPECVPSQQPLPQFIINNIGTYIVQQHARTLNRRSISRFFGLHGNSRYRHGKYSRPIFCSLTRSTFGKTRADTACSEQDDVARDVYVTVMLMIT
jgi:hypothetical protein